MAELPDAAIVKRYKVPINSIRARDTSLKHLRELSAGIERTSVAGMLAEICGAMVDLKPKNYHTAIAAMVKEGRR